MGKGWIAVPLDIVRFIVAATTPPKRATYAEGFFDGYAAGVAEGYVEGVAVRIEAE